jgi:hypothetical protein
MGSPPLAPAPACQKKGVRAFFFFFFFLSPRSEMFLSRFLAFLSAQQVEQKNALKKWGETMSKKFYTKLRGGGGGGGGGVFKKKNKAVFLELQRLCLFVFAKKRLCLFLPKKPPPPSIFC